MQLAIDSHVSTQRTHLLRSQILWVLFLALLLTACGASGPKRATVTPASMPPGGSFTGVFFSPQYGEMQMVQTGASIVGEYHKDERKGRIQGTAQGNLLRFEWSERKERIVGRPTESRGRGYFQLLIDSNGDQVLQGEWGTDLNEVGGGPWRAVKSRSRQPQLEQTNSIGQGDAAPARQGANSLDLSDPSGGTRDSRLDGLSE